MPHHFIPPFDQKKHSALHPSKNNINNLRESRRRFVASLDNTNPRTHPIFSSMPEW